MKKLFVITLVIFLQIITVQALVSADVTPQRRTTPIGGAFNYNNPVRTLPQGHYINKIVVNTTSDRAPVITPPPPPPERGRFKYRDFAGNNKFPIRSYYIPSYCMPERRFYGGDYNPFCNHYRPYGSNLYISF